MALPTCANVLDNSFPLAEYFQQALNEAPLDETRLEAVEILRLRRDRNALKALTNLFPAIKFESYDHNALLNRSKSRVNRMKKILDELFRREKLSVLEIGCGRGEVLHALLSEPNVAVCGLDINEKLFTKNREEFPSLESVFFVSAPAEKVPFAESSFDLIFGYNSMEHFKDPRIVLDECHRLLRPGGFMYFYFGPPFNGPLGPHLHNRIAIPYLQHLFSRDVVADYLGKKGKNPYEGKNEWSTKQFRELFMGDARFDCRYYQQEYVWDHLWLVKQFPEDFVNFDPEELVVRAIEVASQKRQHDAAGSMSPGNTGRVDKISMTGVIDEKNSNPKSDSYDFLAVEGFGLSPEVVDTFRFFTKKHPKRGLGVYSSEDWRRFAHVQRLVVGTTILDVGVGNGAFLHILTGSGKYERIQGIDIRPHSMLQLPEGAEFCTMSVTDLSDFGDGEFDTVLCQEVLEHLELPDFDKSLVELRRVARTRLIVTVPFEEPQPVWWHDKPGGHRQSFSKEKIGEIFPTALAAKVPRSGVPWLLIVEDDRVSADGFRMLELNDMIATMVEIDESHSAG